VAKSSLLYRRRRYDQGSISPTFSEQLLGAQISKAQKDTDGLTIFFVLLGSAHVKASQKMLKKLTPRRS